MSDSDPKMHYAPEPNLLERRATAYLQRRRRAGALKSEHRAATPERLRRVDRSAIMWAAVAGIVSGAVIGGSEVAMRFWYFDGMEDLGWRVQLPYWAGFTVFAGVISAIEILFLYLNALRAAANVSQMADLKLSGSSSSELLAIGLARAALELPNPRILIHGIDPYGRMPGWRINLKRILYRLKVGVSTFALRVFLRRVVGRVAVRGLIPLLAGPIYAAWNGIITWRIMREARVRSFGHAAVTWIVETVGRGRREPHPDVVEIVLQGTGELIMRSCDAHPNYVLLVSRLIEMRRSGAGDVEIDWARTRHKLQELEMVEQATVLDALTLASLLGSHLRKSQKQFVYELHQACRRQLRPDALDRLRGELLDGRSLGKRDLEAIRT